MEQFEQKKYFAKMKFFKLFENEIKIFNEDQSKLLFFVEQKAFKLKEEIKIFSDEAATQLLIGIQAQAILDISATYDVTDHTTGQKVGALRRKGFKSILRDEWVILDVSEKVIGSIKEDSMIKALLRRLLSNLIPQTFDLFFGDKKVGLIKQTFNPFIPQMRVDFSMDSANQLDRKLGIAAVILLQVIEGKQK